MCIRMKNRTLWKNTQKFIFLMCRKNEKYDFEETEGFTAEETPKVTRSVMIDEKTDLKSMLYLDTTTEADISRDDERFD